MASLSSVSLKMKLLETTKRNLPCSKFFENDANFQTMENQQCEETERCLQDIHQISPDEINLNKYKVEQPNRAKVKEYLQRPHSSGLKIEIPKQSGEEVALLS